MPDSLATIRTGRHAEIGAELEAHADLITDEWSERISDEAEVSTTHHREELRNRLPSFVRAMGAALKNPAASSTGPHRLLAVEHGEQRWEIGWKLSDVVSDYQHLRIVILELLDQKMERGLSLHEAIAVGYFLDDAIQAATVTFAEHQGTQLRLAHERLTEFLSVLGHELRNPLSSVAAALQLIEMKVGKVVPEAFDVIDHQLPNITRLLGDMLDVSRITRQQIRLNLTPTRLWPVVERAIQTTRSQVVHRSHSLTIQSPAEELVVKADNARLEQVITNLLTNAAKYTDPGGSIFVTAERREECACIRVRDTGHGIESSVLPHIFDLFVQSPENTGRGLGIGLAIARMIVDQHNGRLEAFSKGVGEGTEFLVTLPLAGQGESARLSPTGSGILKTLKNSDQSSRRILVIDDEVMTAQMLSALLEQCGHQTLMAFDGQEGLDIAREHQPEVILSDIGLPRVDGFTLAKTLRAEEAFTDTFMIAMSGYAHENQKKQAEAAGFDNYLVKPLDIRDLERLLRTTFQA